MRKKHGLHFTDKNLKIFIKIPLKVQLGFKELVRLTSMTSMNSTVPIGGLPFIETSLSTDI